MSVTARRGLALLVVAVAAFLISSVVISQDGPSLAILVLGLVVLGCGAVGIVMLVVGLWRR